VEQDGAPPLLRSEVISWQLVQAATFSMADPAWTASQLET
jgi:hypothetical protein